MASNTKEQAFCLKKHKDFLEISRLINLNFDVNVLVAKSISFISDRLKKRVRIYLVDDRGDLVIEQWSGDYRRELHKGIVVLKSSIVWRVFEKGEPVNITREAEIEEFDHTLRNKVKIKAIIPIKYKDVNTSAEKKYGVMVIDSGADRKKISEENFVYSVEMAELIGQAIARAEFFDEYRRMRDRLILVQQERIKVLDVLVHELRNPLTVIGGFTKKFPGIIEKLYTTIGLKERNAYLDKLFKYSKVVAKEEYRIEESINDFVRFLRMTDPEHKMSISSFNLYSVIEDIISKIEPLAEIKNITICSYNKKKKDIFIEGDKQGIFTVLNNLLYNGINFSPENSRVAIHATEDYDTVSLSVRSDTFIPKQHRTEIFDFFYKIVGKEDKGTGLGLPIAKQIVENHKGSIRLVSRKGRKGKPFTRFVVTLPKKQEGYGL
ncbi:MAG: ATP-binding protein [Pseudomonadota bacterium]